MRELTVRGIKGQPRLDKRQSDSEMKNERVERKWTRLINLLPQQIVLKCLSAPLRHSDAC